MLSLSGIANLFHLVLVVDDHVLVVLDHRLDVFSLLVDDLLLRSNDVVCILAHLKNFHFPKHLLLVCHLSGAFQQQGCFLRGSDGTLPAVV